MLSPSRRTFLGASFAGLASTQFIGHDNLNAEIATQRKPDGPSPWSTLFLTWQRDPTTTMTVQWIGIPGLYPETTIYYWPAKMDRFRRSQLTTSRQYPKSNYGIFRAELSGLAPGTDYCFTVGRQSPVFRFQTMPAKATDAISFISGGDCGVNSHTVSNNIQAARQDPMFAVIGGDLAYDNGSSMETSLAFIRNYSKHMIGRNGRLIPMLACLGNHEVQGGYGNKREKAPFFYAMFDGLYPERGFATLDFGDYLSLVMLDTGHTTPIEGEQTAWLDEVLQERSDHPNVFVVNHVPAYPSFRSAEGKNGTGAANRKHWVPLFEKYRVPVVLEHHDHTFKRTKPLIDGLGNGNGVLYLGDGSWGQIRTPQKPEKLSFLAKTSADYHLSLHRIQGEQRFHLALDENGRVMDVCMSGQRKAGLVQVPG